MYLLVTMPMNIATINTVTNLTWLDGEDLNTHQTESERLCGQYFPPCNK